MDFRANNPQLKSWVEVPADSDFPIQNLPFGVFRAPGQEPRLCSAIGQYVIDLVALGEHKFFEDLHFDLAVFRKDSLNDFIALGRKTTRAVRNRLSEILDTDYEEWDAHELADYFLYPMDKVQLLLPLRVGNYTDFYSSLEHATNVGIMFRGPENALMPNWRHMPIGYHGRASSIVVSGTPIHRPIGQILPDGATQPEFGPSRQLDFEIEVGFVVGKDTNLGQRVDTAAAEDYIFGLALFNDWSARDLQKWEYQPLGPFLGKNFGSTISPWVVTLDALEPFRVSGPAQEPEPLPYLQFAGRRNFDLQLQMTIRTAGGTEKVVSETNFRYMYWNMCQQLAHHTVNGCNICIGDLYASGTISGPEPGSFGSMLELTWRGTRPIAMPDGSERRFLLDGDTCILRGWCTNGQVRVGFGEAAGQVLPVR
jgi:fumarylacetoacetase